MRNSTPKKEEKMIKTSMALPEPLWTAVRIKALEMHVNAQDLVREALEEFLKRKGGAK